MPGLRRHVSRFGLFLCVAVAVLLASPAPALAVVPTSPVGTVDPEPPPEPEPTEEPEPTREPEPTQEPEPTTLPTPTRTATRTPTATRPPDAPATRTATPSPTSFLDDDVTPTITGPAVEETLPLGTLTDDSEPVEQADADDEADDPLARLLQLVVGGAVLLGLAGGVGLYLTREGR